MSRSAGSQLLHRLSVLASSLCNDDKASGNREGLLETSFDVTAVLLELPITVGD
jgi:hypothetical protein